jgi:xylulokinase
VGGVGVGIFSDFSVAAGFSHRTSTRTPDTARHKRYAGDYKSFMQAYRNLEPWFNSLDSTAGPA